MVELPELRDDGVEAARRGGVRRRRGGVELLRGGRVAGRDGKTVAAWGARGGGVR